MKSCIGSTTRQSLRSGARGAGKPRIHTAAKRSRTFSRPQDLPKLLRKYKGREQLLLQAIQRKYTAVPSAPQPAPAPAPAPSSHPPQAEPSPPQPPPPQPAAQGPDPRHSLDGQWQVEWQSGAHVDISVVKGKWQQYQHPYALRGSSAEALFFVWRDGTCQTLDPPRCSEFELRWRTDSPNPVYSTVTWHSIV